MGMAAAILCGSLRRSAYPPARRPVRHHTGRQRQQQKWKRQRHLQKPRLPRADRRAAGINGAAASPICSADCAARF